MQALVTRSLHMFLVAALLLPACGEESSKRERERGPVPVEVAPVTTGTIELRRTFMGTVRSKRSFVVSAHVAGRVQKLFVDLADTVKRGQVVAALDDKEDKQGVSQASAELAVARARLDEVRSALVIADRELQRVEGLHKQGIVPMADLDRAKAQHLAAKTAVTVARAQLTRMGAGLAGARIRSGYNKVVAVWADGADTRLVSQRHVSEGDRVTAGQSILTVVELQPIMVAVDVGERDYGSLAVEQAVVVTTDAHPGIAMPGKVKRIAPVFRESSRSAQVEIELPNQDAALKPGMFVRARIVLERVEGATIVPVTALTTRGGERGVFVVDDAGDKVTWRTVTVGIRQDQLVAVAGDGIVGRVVTLGQQLIGDDSRIAIPPPEAPAAAAKDEKPGKKRRRKGRPGG